MKDQNNAAQMREKALNLSIELLKTLEEHEQKYPNDQPHPFRDALRCAEEAAWLIACEALNLQDAEQAEAYVNERLGRTKE